MRYAGALWGLVDLLGTIGVMSVEKGGEDGSMEQWESEIGETTSNEVGIEWSKIGTKFDGMMFDVKLEGS